MTFDDNIGTYTTNFKISICEKTKQLENEHVFLVVKTEEDFIRPYIVERLAVISRRKEKSSFK